MILAVFDFETSDNDPRTCRITEAACVLYCTERQREIMSFSSLLWDETYPTIAPVAAKITGITDDLLKEHAQHAWCAPRFILAQLGAFLLRADYVVGHNIRKFDLPLLHEELKRNSLELSALPPNIDTRFDIEYPEHIDTRKLAYLASEHGIPPGLSHAALHDCHTTARLLFSYPLERVIHVSQSPDLYVRADVSFQDKEKAKEKKYFWDSEQKIWVKQLKEMFLEKEIADCSFPVLTLTNYNPPERK